MRKRLKLSFERLEDTLTLVSPLEAPSVLGGYLGPSLDRDASVSDILKYYSGLGFTFSQDENGNYSMTGGASYSGPEIKIDPVTIMGEGYDPDKDIDNQYGIAMQAKLGQLLEEHRPELYMRSGNGSTDDFYGSTDSEDGSADFNDGSTGVGGSENNDYWTFEDNRWKWNGAGKPDPSAMHYGENIEEVVVRPPSLNDLQWKKLNYLMSVSNTVGEMNFDYPIANNTFEAVALYYIGIGRSVTIGPNSMRDLLSSDQFYDFHHSASEQLFGTVIDDRFDFTNTVFHIGRTSVKAFVGSGYVTYMMFEGDGFKDPNFWAENNNWSTADGHGPNLELGGNSYDYNVSVFSLPFY